jgi:hypothetical protein
VDDESKTETQTAQEPPPVPPARLTRSWQRRGNWIMLGRVLGGFGAFIAAMVAAAQFAFGGDDPSVSARTTTTVASGRYAFAERRDDGGTIRAELPTAWGNIDGRPWTANGIPGFANGAVLGAKLLASPNVSSWRAPGELETPGLLVGVSEPLAAQWTARSLAKAFNYAGCRYASDEPFSAEGLEGWEVRSTCPGSEARWVTLAATGQAVPGALLFVQAKLVGPDDDEAYERALATLVLHRG